MSRGTRAIAQLICRMLNTVYHSLARVLTFVGEGHRYAWAQVKVTNVCLGLCTLMYFA